MGKNANCSPAVFSALVTAYVLALLVAATGEGVLVCGMRSALLSWFAFVLVIMGTQYTFEARSELSLARACRGEALCGELCALLAGCLRMESGGVTYPESNQEKESQGRQMMHSSCSHVNRPLTLLVAAALAIPAVLTAQGEAKRHASARPDLSGTYDTSTLTPLVRPLDLGDRLELTDAEAAEISRIKAELYAADLAPSDPDREAPPIGGTGVFDPSLDGAGGGSGGYNGFYMDPGLNATKIDGKWRTSILIEPSNGRMPALTAEAKAKRKERSVFAKPNTGTAWWLDLDIGPYDNIEQRPHAERCIVGFTGATPSFPSLYNNFKRIVQTDTHVMFLIEMNHDARVVRLDSEHPPEDITTWLGDSVGWWEDDTLVVKSKNFRPGTQGRGGTETLTVIERFTKLADGNLVYRFTVDDKTVWTEPWTGEYLWRTTDDKVFEYACHEGNYAMGNIMRGARLLEREALK